MRATYNGDQKVVFSHYLDVTKPEEFTTLVAEPGKTYEIKQAEGHTQIQPDGQFEPYRLPMPPSDDWTETSEPTWAEVEAKEAAETPPAETPPAASAPAPAARPKKKEIG